MIAKAGKGRFQKNQVTEMLVENGVTSGHVEGKCRRNARRAQALSPLLFTLQKICGIGVPPMETTNMAGTAMPR
jgi:hypothetical protein